MIDKDLIIINKIEPVYESKTFIGENSVLIQVGLRVEFTYKQMNTDIRFNTDTICGDEIKNAIILREQFK